MASKEGLKKVNDKLYIAKYGKAGNAVAIDFTRDGSKAIEAIEYAEGNGKGKVSKDYFKRGKNDNRLLEMHKLATESPNKWQLIETRGSFIAGGGIKIFNRTIENNREVLVPDIENEKWDNFYERLELDEYWEAAAMQCSFGAELNVKLTLNSDDENGKAASLQVIDNNDIRAVVPESGKRIEMFLLSDQFGYSKSLKVEDCDDIPAFDPTNPTKFPVSIIHLAAKKPGQKVYGLANWWGTEHWTRVANDVPTYYEAAFQNGFFVTHHVQFPDDYFDRDGLDDETEIEKLKERTLDEITDTLSSIEEANKIIVTFSKIAADGKSSLKEVKIEPLPSPIKDEAFIKMFEAANLVQASGHGVPGKLAGVQLGSDMGSSGKEIAAEAAYMQDFLTVFDRARLVKPVWIAAKIDGIELKGKKIAIDRIDSYVQGSTAKDDVSHPNN
ncbi:hypothetical protein [Jiulongibacter sp. NS-SX5]|uniref:hypothetical protein n=1 Tax=Jiulongibacter sp. NS-SX5 TaxID=3463854 RepID=UPI0040588A53